MEWRVPLIFFLHQLIHTSFWRWSNSFVVPRTILQGGCGNCCPLLFFRIWADQIKTATSACNLPLRTLLMSWACSGL